MIPNQENTFRSNTLKIPFTKMAFWGVILFSSWAIMFLFFGFEFYHKILGGIFVLCAITCFKYEYGFEITDKSEVRDYHKVFNYVFGKWKAIPEIRYITVIRVFEYGHPSRTGTNVFIKRKTHQVNLVFRNKRQKRINSFKNKDIAETIGNKLSSFLNVKLHSKT